MVVYRLFIGHERKWHELERGFAVQPISQGRNEFMLWTYLDTTFIVVHSQQESFRLVEYQIYNKKKNTHTRMRVQNLMSKDFEWCNSSNMRLWNPSSSESSCRQCHEYFCMVIDIPDTNNVYNGHIRDQKQRGSYLSEAVYGSMMYFIPKTP